MCCGGRWRGSGSTRGRDSRPTASSTWEAEMNRSPRRSPTEGTLVRLISFHALYVSARDASEDYAIRQEPRPSAWELFERISLGDDRIALRTHHGLYVSARGRRSNFVLGQESQLGD